MTSFRSRLPHLEVGLLVVVRCAASLACDTAWGSLPNTVVLRKHHHVAIPRRHECSDRAIGYTFDSRVEKADLRAMRQWLEKQDKWPLTQCHVLSAVGCLSRCRIASAPASTLSAPLREPRKFV